MTSWWCCASFVNFVWGFYLFIVVFSRYITYDLKLDNIVFRNQLSQYLTSVLSIQGLLYFTIDAKHFVGEKLHTFVAVGSIVICLFNIFLVYVNLVAGPKPRFVDLTGKTFIVTGANAGIGLETTKLLAEMNAHVIMGCRNEKRAMQAELAIRKAIGLKGKLTIVPLDLTDMDSIRQFAKEMEQYSIDALINNAGLMSTHRVLTKEGHELTMASNYIGHFVLSNLLLSQLEDKADGRIVNVASCMHMFAKQNPCDDLMVEKNYNILKAYNQSKLCTMLFTRELHKRTKSTKVNVVHPGMVITDITRGFPRFLEILYKLIQPLSQFLLKSGSQGAFTSVYAATSPNMKNCSGLYLADSAPMSMSTIAKSDEVAKQLWEETIQLTAK